MSTRIEYDPARVYLDQQLADDTWQDIDAASITLTQTYDVGETGVLLVGYDSLDFQVSYYVTQQIPTIDLGDVVRLRYGQPGDDELFTGFVADVSVDYTTDPEAQRHGKHRRADYRVSCTSLAASKVAGEVSWTTLPAEPVSARLARWIPVVHLGSATDATMPAETEQGSTTLLEVIRAASEYAGRPFRLKNTADHGVEVQAVGPDTALPGGYTSDDALDLYTSASISKSAGDRVISTDAGDRTLTITSNLANDDVRLIYSGWRIPDALPSPFNNISRVTSWSQTFTPDGYTSSVSFDAPTSNATRARPVEAYVAGDPTTTGGTGDTSTGGGGDVPVEIGPELPQTDRPHGSLFLRTTDRRLFLSIPPGIWSPLLVLGDGPVQYGLTLPSPVGYWRNGDLFLCLTDATIYLYFAGTWIALLRIGGEQHVNGDRLGVLGLGTGQRVLFTGHVTFLIGAGATGDLVFQLGQNGDSHAAMSVSAHLTDGTDLGTRHARIGTDISNDSARFTLDNPTEFDVQLFATINGHAHSTGPAGAAVVTWVADPGANVSITPDDGGITFTPLIYPA